MQRAKKTALIVAAAAAAHAFVGIGRVAQAADLTWNPASTGTQPWDLAANWDGVSFPNAIDDKANLSVNLPLDLTVNIPAAGITIAFEACRLTGRPCERIAPPRAPPVSS